MTYWTFRLMIGFGMLAGLLSVIGLWLTRRGGARQVPRWYCRAALAGLFLPVRRQQRGLDLHRDGPPALVGVRPAAHRRRRLDRRSASALGADVVDRLHAALRRAGRGRTACSWCRYAKAATAPADPADARGRRPTTPRPMTVAY